MEKQQRKKNGQTDTVEICLKFFQAQKLVKRVLCITELKQAQKVYFIRTKIMNCFYKSFNILAVLGRSM